MRWIVSRLPITGWAIGMVAERELVEQLVGGRENVFLVLDQLVQDHLALALELGLGKAAVEDDVAEHGDEARRVLGQAAHVVRGVVLVGVGVDVGAEPLGIEVDLLAGALVRALERHVLDEVADAVEAPALVAAAGADEHADVDAPQVRQADGDDANAVAERRHGRVGVAQVGAHGVDPGVEVGRREQLDQGVDVDRLDQVVVEAGFAACGADRRRGPSR